MARSFTDFQALLDATDIELVCICTPPHLHRAQILQAPAAGKHVVCEKPVVVSLNELDDVAAAAATRGRGVFPTLRSRWGLGLQQLLHIETCGLARHAHVATVETHWRREAGG